MSQELVGLLKKRIFTAQIMWGALAFSVLMYVFVAFSAKNQTPEASADLASAFMSPVVQVLTAAALMMCFVQFFISKILMPSSAKIEVPGNLGEALRAVRGKNGQRVWSDVEVEAATKLSPDEGRILFCFQRWFVAFILGMALSESVVVFGLVIAFTQGPPVVIFPFALVTLILFAMRFPSVSGYVRQVDSSKKVI